MSLGFEVLAGLPPYGPAALPFPPDGRGAFREGLVVRFRPGGGGVAAAWVGNFQRGGTGLDAVLDHPDGRRAVVIAGGAGHIVDPRTRQAAYDGLPDAIEFAAPVPALGILLLGDGLGFATLTAGGVGWTSGRISWDGMQGIVIASTRLRGEAYSPIPPGWHSFELDLATGACVGAIYPEQMAGAMRVGPRRA